MTRRILMTAAAIMLSLLSVLAQQSAQYQRLRHHVEILASDSLGGRAAGTSDAAKAADYITAEFDAMGLNCQQQHFKRGSDNYRNIVGRIEGTCDTMIVIGAHYDHLGIKNGRIYPGADDNASGTAVLIELARNLLADGIKPRYTILLVAFDGEELGLYGSTFLASQLPLDKVALMVSIDMVGWMRATDCLTLEGTGTIADSHTIVAATAAACDITIREKSFETSLLTATDTQAFAMGGVPTLAVTTGTKSPYHKPEDTADKIDYDGLERVCDFMTALTSAVVADGIASSGHRSFKHGDMPRLSAGVTAGLGNNYHHYIDGALEGKSDAAYNVGLFLQYNLNRAIGVRAATVFEDRAAKTPDRSDIFGKSRTLKIKSVTLPVDILLTTSNDNPVYMIASGGIYGACIIGARLDEERLNLTTEKINRFEWGLQWGLGCNLYKLYLTANVRYAMTEVFADVHTRNYCSYFTIGYRF